MTEISVEKPERQSLQNTLKSGLCPLLSSPELVSFPSSAEFQSSNLRFTEFERPTYVAAVRPVCEKDVVETIKYARSQAIPFAARSGHHCVTTTMGQLQNGILLDMRSIKHTEFDAEKQEVTIGGGILLDDFTKFVHSLGMEVTVGSCPTTGIIGVSFGAGLGRLQGKYGYLNDNMVSCKMVLADGTVTTVSEESHADLFWAIRGAGHNFGIALEATYRVYPQTNQGIHHSWDMGYSLDQCEDLFELLNDVHHTMPPDLAIFVLWKRQFPTGEKDLILVNLVFHGCESDAKKWVSQFEALRPKVSSGKLSLSWPDLPWEACAAQNKLISRPEVWKMTPYKGMAAVNVKKFDPQVMRAFFESVKDMNTRYEGKGWFGAMFECFSHQRTREIASDATAFPWRHGGDHQIMVSATPRDMKDMKPFVEFLDEWKAKFIQVSGFGRLHQYVNYGNTTPNHDQPEALYGYEPWRLRKLRTLKQRYDPDGIFSWYQPFV
ncbi:FAD linked oxidase [Coleophoma crateriformis]|uniref:FAD linked oxidase n=1 Tax=Coleophoma crateriformis TaxID=565419 RepID=A0A3D8R472_9HELO|nr:FAD linked oxidase [Coleophoma crateriformis]